MNLLGKLSNTYPGATLHDCDDGSDINPVRLDNTALGNYPLRTSPNLLITGDAMGFMQDHFPVFEANQVLTNAHLNDLFEYLDEQTRLTRSNLIGIGIVCGLEVTFEAPGTVHLSKGCGVTSQGYLIVEPDGSRSRLRALVQAADRVRLSAVRRAGHEPARAVRPVGAVPRRRRARRPAARDERPRARGQGGVLFLELRKDGLRNCSPNNCDDRGAEVTATVRRLLIDVADLDKVIAARPAGPPSTDLGADLTERLDLPDLRMPRFDVPNSGPVATAKRCSSRFQATFRQNKLVAATAAALTALYDAFKPLVVDEYPTNPFATFTNRFGFLDATPATTAQVRFMQYYWDLFDDLLAAYDELRWKGVDLMCACCPPEGLFPRHLMAGVLDPATYDTGRLPPPVRAVAGGRRLRGPHPRRCVQLFRRSGWRSLDRASSLPGAAGQGRSADRITRAAGATSPLSAKAIPYYYDQDGTPPLYRAVGPGEDRAASGPTRTSATGPTSTRRPRRPFVTDPLRFDLEPNNFLRIEGHLGKNVQSVLETLLALQKSHRLPIEVIALRTGRLRREHRRRPEQGGVPLPGPRDAVRRAARASCLLPRQAGRSTSTTLPSPRSVLGGPCPTLGLLKRYAAGLRRQPGRSAHDREILTWNPGHAATSTSTRTRSTPTRC